MKSIIRQVICFGAVFGLVASVTLVGVSPVHAAEGDGADMEAAGAEEADVSGSSLTAKEKQAFAEKAVSELDGATRKALRMIEEAQKAKNVMLLNCLNEKLAALRGLLKVGEDAEFDLSEAIARENADLQQHNFRKVFIARNQGLTVAAEADACVGASAGAMGGGTKVVVTIAAESGEGGLSDAGGPPGPNGEPPSSGADAGSAVPPDTSPGD